jgi:hypothetical protein
VGYIAVIEHVPVEVGYIAVIEYVPGQEVDT